MEIRELIDTLNNATKQYDAGHPVMSDEHWDDLYFELQRLENETNTYYDDSPTQAIHFETVSSLPKVEHQHKMLSLAKTKNIQDIVNFFDPGYDWILMPKLDGLTCSLLYENGVLVAAETRGNGEVGENVYHNALVVKSIPKKINYKQRLVVDGEIICTYQNFEQFKDTYQHPRNFASGSIRLLDSAECARRNLDFVVWEVIEGFDDLEYLHEKLEKVEELGFKTVFWGLPDAYDEQEFIKTRAKKYGWPIDGLVFKYDNIAYGKSKGSTGHHFNNAMALKFYDESTSTSLLDIEWSMGRMGTLTPVAIFETIEIDGTDVSRASLHNVSVMKEILGEYPYVGMPLEIIKANQIIPQVLPVDEEYRISEDTPNILFIPYPTVCPYCGSPVSLVESEAGIATFVCTNPECSGKFINALDHFCGKKGLDIMGISTGVLEDLINWGWINEIEDIFNLDQYRVAWVNKPGYGESSVDNYLKAIKEKQKEVEFCNFISALGIPLMGRSMARLLSTQFENYEALKKQAKERKDFTYIPGFGYSKEAALWAYDWDKADRIYAKIENVKNSYWKNEIVGADSLNGLTFVITGSLNNFANRDELKAKIEASGGKVASSVSSKTNYLINNDITSNSSKNQKAKSMNVPIISEQDFIEKFLS